jgi:predicted regulator of Ras-like GTPase activity (Roadblock/LC7/MglB family)
MNSAAMSGSTGRTWSDGGSAGAGRASSAQQQETGGLGWLLDDMVDRIAQVRHALILSSDGLVSGASRDLLGSDAEHLAAVSSGFHSLAKGAGRHFGAGDARQTMVEFEDGFLFVTAAGDGSCLSVFTGEGTDVGQIAYEMTLLVHRVGEHLGVAPRHDSGAHTGT